MGAARSASIPLLRPAIFAGCDLNTNMDDMELLTDLCPYVLASVGCLTDANDATGYGVFASIEVRRGSRAHLS